MEQQFKERVKALLELCDKIVYLILRGFDEEVAQKFVQCNVNLQELQKLDASLKKQGIQTLVDLQQLEKYQRPLERHLLEKNMGECLYILERKIIPILNTELILEDTRKKAPFLVEGWHTLLENLERVSLFYFIRTFIPNLKIGDQLLFAGLQQYFKGNYRFVDIWVILNTILSIASVFIAYLHFIPLWCKYVFLLYGFIRVFEVFIYQLNVIFVHPYRGGVTKYALKSYRRMTILLLHNFAEIIFWFAGTYLILQFVVDVNPATAITQSFMQMLTYSFEIENTKWPILALIVLQIQAIIGVFMTILSLARFTSLFPQPETLDNSEKELTLRDEIAKLQTNIEALKHQFEDIQVIENEKQVK